MSGWLYALSFHLAKLITFADTNYASLYPMCVICGIHGKQIYVVGGGGRDEGGGDGGGCMHAHIYTYIFCGMRIMYSQCTTRVMLSTHFIHTPVAVVSLHPLTSSWVLQVRVVFGRRGHGAMGQARGR